MKVGVSSLVAVLVFASPARAATMGDVPLRDGDRVGASLSEAFTASPQAKAVKMLASVTTLSAAYRPRPRWTLTLDAGLSLTSYRLENQSPGSVARAGNPLLGVQLSLPISERLSMRVGIFAGAPLVTVPGGLTSNAAAELADRTATAATGQTLYWMWARNVAPLVALGRLAYRPAERVVLGVDVQPAFLVSVNRDASYVALLATFEARVELGVFAPGIRLASLVTSRPRDTNDFAQAAASAFLRIDGGRAFGAVEFVSGLDGPQGPGRPDQTWWGATLTGGARF